MIKRLLVTCAFALASTMALAQSLPTPNFGGLKINGTTQTFPASGNIVGTTDVQTLTNKIITSPTIDTRPVWSDLTSSAGSSASMWTIYYSNPGTAIIDRTNRLFIGPATVASGDVPMTTKDWSETLIPNTTSQANLSVDSTIGGLAVYGASRASDHQTAGLGATGGAEGVTGLGYNDDTIGNAIACGVCGIAVQHAGGNGISLNQMDIDSLDPTVSTTPHNGVAGGTTWALGLTSGAYSSLGSLQNPTGAMYIGGNSGTTHFNKGIIFMDDALDTTQGDTGGGVAMQMPEGASVQWLNSSNTVVGEVAVSGASYTPTIGFSGGSGTSAAIVEAQYYDFGHVMWVSLKATVSYSTAPSMVTFTLPNSQTCAADAVLTGIENATGKSLNGICGTTSNIVYVRNYDGASPIGASGDAISISGFIEH